MFESIFKYKLVNSSLTKRKVIYRIENTISEFELFDSESADYI